MVSMPITPGCRYVIYIVAFHTVYHTFLQSVCRGVQHSLFYAPKMNVVKERMAARIGYAERVMKRRASGSGGKEDVDCERKFCVGVVGTEVRLEHSYMLAAVGSLTGLGGVGSDCRTDKFFVQVRGKPNEGGEGEKWVRRTVKMLLRGVLTRSPPLPPSSRRD